MSANKLLELTDGVVPLDELKKHPSYPSEARLARGPIAVIECIEAIPCNPCQTVCNRSVIRVGEPITNLPELISQEDLCTGCGQCVVICPGLAIFIVDKAFSDSQAAITLPYEFQPLPQKGQPIVGINRAGQPVCEGTVHSVRSVKGFDHTSLVTIVVPKEMAEEVRFFRRRQG